MSDMVELQNDSLSSETSERSLNLDIQEDDDDDDDGYGMICRLCHRRAQINDNDIYTSITPASPSSVVSDKSSVTETDNEEDAMKADDTDTSCQEISYAALLKDLFRIEYEQHELLPRLMCTDCFTMIQVFREFRHCLRKAEEELQIRLHTVKMANSKYRPGLNGNPGTFEPDSDCEIIEVNPEGDFISSDDEFSESESEEEEEGTNELEDRDEDIEENGVENAQSNNPEPLNDETTTTQQENADTNMLEPILTTALPSFLQTTHNVAAMVPGVPDALAMNTNLDASPKNTFLCQFCDLAFTTPTDCHDHELRQHDPSLPYSCSFCQLHLLTRQLLIGHIKESHDPERPYVCAACNKGFCRRSDLKKHTIVHTGVRPFTCMVCSKSFSRNTNLTKHMRIHSSVKPFVCQVCPRSFQTAIELMRHTRSHTEVKPHQCGRCPASFTRKDKLLLHEQVHVRRDAELLQQQARLANVGLLPPIQAPVPVPASVPVSVPVPVNNIPMENMMVMAANTTTNACAEPENDGQPLYPHSILAAQLQQQMPTKQYPTAVSSDGPPPPTLPPVASVSPMPKPAHSRNFHCEICDKSFQRERDLQRHKALHLDTLFTCKLCGIGFSRPEKLARHELEQHAPHYPCDICRITFVRQEELEHHLKMHELQQHVAMNTQAALNATASAAVQTPEITQDVPMPMALPPPPPLQVHRPSAADMSFYSQMVPTMNLGFYSETHPEERNGI